MLLDYSEYLDNAVNEIAKLPGIGRRTALRLTLHLIKSNSTDVESLVQAILDLKTSLHHCKICNNISDSDVCNICNNPKRNQSQICVVQDIRDIIAIENTQQYKGVYHVLGGIISPIDGIGPNQIKLQELFDRVQQNIIQEIILALPATTEGDTTNFYIYKNVKEHVANITTISRGIGVGEELEYTDEVTLGRSILARTNFDTQYGKKQ